jgi:DNA polymerase (family 10)
MPPEKSKIILERAQKTAEAIVKRLAPYCKPDKIVVAGSIRRRRPWVHDIDIVLIPSDPWNLQQEILNLSRPMKPLLQGEKVMRFMLGDIQVDLYFATEDNWATLLLIRTGSTENNIRLCSRAKEMGWHLHADGSGLYNQYGKRVAGDTEISIYNALGLPYQTPEERG